MQSQFEKLRDTATTASQQCSSGVSSLQQSLSLLLERLEQPWPSTDDLSQLKKVLRQDTRRVVGIIKTMLALVREVQGAVCGSEASSGLQQHLSAGVRHEMAAVLSAVSIVQADCNTNTSLLQNIAGDVIQVKEELGRLRAAVEDLPSRVAPLLQQRGRSLLLQSPVAEVRPSPRPSQAVLRRTTQAPPSWQHPHLPQPTTTRGTSSLRPHGNVPKRHNVDEVAEDALSRSGASDTTTPTLPVQDFLSSKSLIEAGANGGLGSSRKHLSDSAVQLDRFSVRNSRGTSFQCTADYARGSTGNKHPSQRENDALDKRNQLEDPKSISNFDGGCGQESDHHSGEDPRHDDRHGALAGPGSGPPSDLKFSSEFSPDWLVVQKTEIKRRVVQQITTNEFRQSKTANYSRASGSNLGNKIRDDGRYKNATTRTSTASFNNNDEELEIFAVPESPDVAALHQATGSTCALMRTSQRNVTTPMQNSANRAAGAERSLSPANAVPHRGTSDFCNPSVEKVSKSTTGTRLQPGQRTVEHINRTPLTTPVAGPGEMCPSPSSSIHRSDIGSSHLLMRSRTPQQRKFFRHSRYLSFTHATGSSVMSTQSRDGGHLPNNTSSVRTHNTNTHTAHLEHDKGWSTGSSNKENAGQLTSTGEHRKECTTPRQERGYVQPSRPEKKCVSVDEFVQQASVGTPKHMLHNRRPVTTPLRLARGTVGGGQGGRPH